MHDAGVDAVSTGQSFLRLAHLVSMEEYVFSLLN